MLRAKNEFVWMSGMTAEITVSDSFFSLILFFIRHILLLRGTVAPKISSNADRKRYLPNGCAQKRLYKESDIKPVVIYQLLEI